MPSLRSCLRKTLCSHPTTATPQIAPAHGIFLAINTPAGGIRRRNRTPPLDAVRRIAYLPASPLQEAAVPELAIDFGTSNTAAAVLTDGRAQIIPLEGADETLPTAIFLDFSARRTLVGNAAVRALIDGREGRFMRALKSVLGTPLMREKRQFLNERLTLIEITARFLASVRASAQAQCGTTFHRALSGRPVRFHSKSAARDAQAERDLRDVYLAAGFTSVRFMPEPEAAALASEDSAQGDGAQATAQLTGLIVDIGGGTSDFTLFRKTGSAGARETQIVASHGIRLGGTDFDRTLSLAHVMPLLGRGSGLKAEFGDQVTAAPAALFNDLATWAKIPFLYTGAARRDVGRMQRSAVEPEKFARLQTVLDMELGHDIAFAVERAKIGANADAAARIDLALIERGLGADLPRPALTRALAPAAAEIAQAAMETLDRAGVAPDDVDRVVFVGGSSLLASVTEALAGALPHAEMHHGKAFTAIVDGLARATARPGL